MKADPGSTVPVGLSAQKVGIPSQTVNQLLAALLLTSTGVFIAGNALLANSAVLARSLPIGLTSLAILALFCALARILRSLAWALSACYGLLIVTVYGPQAWTIPALTIAVAFGLAHTLVRLRLSRRDLVGALGMSAIGTATILGTGSAYTSFDMIERLNVGNVSLDTLYHASIAAMIKNYGITSTGLNGLVETPYHVLSHVLFAAVSLISRAPVIEVYGVAIWVLFAPLLIFTASASCLLVSDRSRLDPARVWVSVCLLLVFAPLLLDRWAVWDSYFVSESYLVALSPFLLAIPLLLSASLGAAELVLLTVMVLLVCAAKAPVGLILLGLFFIRLVALNGRWRFRETLTLLLMSAAASWVMLTMAIANWTSVSFAPLEFVEKYSFLGQYLFAAHESIAGQASAGWRVWLLAAMSLGSFLVLHFVVSWVVVGIVASRVGLRRALTAPIVIISFAAILAGLAVVLLFRIFGGSAYYFTNVAFFVSLPAAAALLAEFLGRPAFSRWPLLPTAVALVLMASVGSYWDDSALSSARVTTKNSELIRRLLEARQFSRRDVIFEANEALLDSNPVEPCLARPFVFPAVSERPWTAVMTVGTDCRYEDYGYENYRSPAGSAGAPPPRWPFGRSAVVAHVTLPR